MDVPRNRQFGNALGHTCCFCAHAALEQRQGKPRVPLASFPTRASAIGCGLLTVRLTALTLSRLRWFGCPAEIEDIGTTGVFGGFGVEMPL